MGKSKSVSVSKVVIIAYLHKPVYKQSEWKSTHLKAKKGTREWIFTQFGMVDLKGMYHVNNLLCYDDEVTMFLVIKFSFLLSFALFTLFLYDFPEK